MSNQTTPEPRKRRLPAPATVISIIALVVAASGTTLAASHLVRGDSLIKVNSLSGNRIKTSSLTGKQIKANSVTGKQINAATLGPVPSAAAVSGFTPSRIFKTAAASTGPFRILNAGGLALDLTCDGGKVPHITALNVGPVNGELDWTLFNGSASTTTIRTVTQFASGSSVGQDVTLTAPWGDVNLTFARVDGHVVTVQLTFQNKPAIDNFDGCSTDGTALAG
jgi:hypothetical protein